MSSNPRIYMYYGGSTYSCMATGQSPYHGLGLQPRLYAVSICDDSAAVAAYADIVALYKWTLPLPLQRLAPSYFADELHHPAETEFRQRLRSASSPALFVPRNPTVNLRRPSFPGRRRSGLEQSSSARHTSASTLSTFRIHVKTHYYNFCYP